MPLKPPLAVDLCFRSTFRLDTHIITKGYALTCLRLGRSTQMWPIKRLGVN